MSVGLFEGLWRPNTMGLRPNLPPEACLRLFQELLGRVQKTCLALEHFALEAMKSCSPEQIGPLMQFAQEFDARNVLEQQPLKPRLAVKAALKQLSRAEGELAKSEGMKPHVLLDSLKGVAALGVSEEEVKAQLQRVLKATDERLLKSFKETLKGEAWPLLKGLEAPASHCA